MATISIAPETPDVTGTLWRARAEGKESFGRSAGEALDALEPELDPETSSTLVLVQHFRPDRFFTAEQQNRLIELMARWRAARDVGSRLPSNEQAELEALVEAELEGAAQRAEAMLNEQKR